MSSTNYRTPTFTSGSIRSVPVLWRALGLTAAGLVLLTASTRWALESDFARDRLREAVIAKLALRCPSAQLKGGAHVEGLDRLAFGPLVVPSRTAPAHPPLLAIERVVVRPCLSALFTPHHRFWTIALEGVRVEAGHHGEALGELAATLRASNGVLQESPHAPRATGESLRFDFSRLTIDNDSSGPGRPPYAFGLLSGSATLSDEGALRSALLEVNSPAGGRGAIQLQWGAGPTSLSVRAEALSPADLPAALRTRWPVEVSSGRADFTLDATMAPAGAAGSGRFALQLQQLFLRTERLGPTAVGPLTFEIVGTARWDRSRHRLALEGTRITLAEDPRTALELSAAFEFRPEPRATLDLRAKALNWEATMAALPADLTPPPAAPKMRGTLAAHLHAAGPLHDLTAWDIQGDFDPERLDPVPTAGGLDLTRTFTWTAPVAGGGQRTVIVGPANTAFVPLRALPTFVIRSVLVSEDAGFYGHHGFDLEEIQEALARAEDGHRLRGASTITQQLAKNLFLSRERTWVRKGREALSTLALEGSLDKSRLLEIYLNVVEWGPGVNGIGEAARHWFGKDARDLQPKEAAFLATIIPNPVRYEMYRRRGALTEAWERRVRELLLKLRSVDALDDDQLEQALSEELHFAGRP